MAVQKRSISFHESVLAEAERLSAERGESLSAFVNAAVKQQLKIERGRTDGSTPAVDRVRAGTRGSGVS